MCDTPEAFYKTQYEWKSQYYEEYPKKRKNKENATNKKIPANY